MDEEEKRKIARRRVLKGAKIVINDGFSTFACTVRNFSEIGANLRIASIIGIPEQFKLVLDDGQSFNCKVIWRRESELGVSFIAPQ
ncbi:PilZ domain-containing protein [uncultured Devosia sp.]|uniref:PilZ domain-containing protein n=1 Tax=uncultured Devosia sp. TaxID=211434 RepID=UPI0035CB73A1